MEATPETLSQKAPRFNARPLVLCAAGVSLGIFLAYQLKGTFAVTAACLFLCAGACALMSRRPVWGVLLLAICAGLFRMLAALPVLPQAGAHTISGVVADAPETKGDFAYVVLYDAACDGTPVNTRIQVRFAAEKAAKLKCGDVISAGAYLSIPQTGGEGTFDARAYYLSIGIGALAYAGGTPTVHAHRLGLRYRLALLRGNIGATLDAAFGAEAPLARALLLNDKTLLAEERYAAFRDAGVAHILALSGLHVSIFVALLALILPKQHGYWRLFGIALFLLAYLVLTNFPPSLIRAAVMSLAALAAPLLLRRYDMPSALSLALLLILLASPASLFSVGLQLSFGAVAGIAMLLPQLRRLLRRLPEKLSSALCVPLAGTLGTLPLTLYYFERLPLYSLPANLIIVPLVTVALPLLLLATLLMALFPGAAFLAWPARFMVALIAWLSEGFGNLPFATLTFTAPPFVACLLLYGAMLALSPYHLRPKRTKLLSAAGCLALTGAILAASRF